MYVADSHGLLWFLAQDRRLGNEAKRIFESADKGEEIIIIPSIVLLECLYICEHHGIQLEFKRVLERIEEGVNYLVYPLDIETVIECENIKTLELHDRIIVAAAKILNTRVITKDSEIIKSGLVETVW